tara:strand:+ start:154 stop:858 length:705 start_codon:yes stop_codon:yes gene_type:complete
VFLWTKVLPLRPAIAVREVTIEDLGVHYSEQIMHASADVSAVTHTVVSEPVEEPAQIEAVPDVFEPKEPTVAVTASASDLKDWELAHTWNISIPSLGISAPVLLPSLTYWYAYAWAMLEKQMQAGLNYGAVAYPHSVAPGTDGNLIIAGHSSPPDEKSEKSAYGHLFAKLPEIAIGEEIIVSDVTYRVQDKFVVSPSETSILAQQEDESILKMITCYPVGTTTNRMIIVAKKVK